MQVLDINPEEEEEIEGANVDLDSQRKGKSVVIKTTTRQTYFLPVAGLVEPEKLKPGDLVGVNKVSCPYIWFMRSTTLIKNLFSFNVRKELLRLLIQK